METEVFPIRRTLERFMRQALEAQPAFLVRGSSRRIMSMRFRPANIRLINRRVDRLGRHSRNIAKFELDPFGHIRTRAARSVGFRGLESWP